MEIARRAWERHALERPIVQVSVKPCRVFRDSSAATFRRRLRDRRFVSVERRGKMIIGRLDDGGGMLAHLGMTGKVIHREAGVESPDGTRATLRFAEGDALCFVSRRLFGRLWAAPLGVLHARSGWEELGPDPLLGPFDTELLAAALADRDAPVKNVLMDQRRLAGIGNIQAAEALWRARIHPGRPARTLSRVEVGQLRRGIIATIEYTLAQADVNEIRYLGEGHAPNPFRVYGRAGERCRRCKTEIVREVQGGRATFFCPGCQLRRVRPATGRAAPRRSKQRPRRA